MIRTYDNPLLEALGAAVDRARADRVTVPPRTEVCPDCQGAGRPHCVCSGTGEVPADGVVHCSNPSCDVVCWADEVCRHTEDVALCVDCAPAGCRDCITERSER